MRHIRRGITGVDNRIRICLQRVRLRESYDLIVFHARRIEAIDNFARL